MRSTTQANHPAYSKILIILLVAIFSCNRTPVKVQPLNRDGFKFEEQDITQIQLGIREGRFTVKELAGAYLERIKSIDRNGPVLNSIISINPDLLEL